MVHRPAIFPWKIKGYGNVIFSASGDLLVAGAAIDTSFALHHEGEILATLSSNQMAPAVRFGRLTDTFQGYNAKRWRLGFATHFRLTFNKASPGVKSPILRMFSEFSAWPA